MSQERLKQPPGVGTPDPRLLPLVDLLARAAYEAILRGEYRGPRSLHEDAADVPEVPTCRPAA